MTGHRHARRDPGTTGTGWSHRGPVIDGRGVQLGPGAV